MAGWVESGTMLLMNGSLATPRRMLVPVAAPPSAHPAEGPRVRRYRMARLPQHTRTDPKADNFAHLRRSYD